MGSDKREAASSKLNKKDTKTGYEYTRGLSFSCLTPVDDSRILNLEANDPNPLP